MQSLIIKHSEGERSIVYDADTEETPTLPHTYVHMMPIEIDRIKNAKIDDVQNILKRYI